MGKVLKYDADMFLSEEERTVLDETLVRLNGEKCSEGGKAAIVFKDIKEHIVEFCKADAEFCRAVHDSGESVSKCCIAILKDVGSGISDIEAYRRAVKFYLPHADVIASISIVTHDAEKTDVPTSRTRILNLWDL